MSVGGPCNGSTSELQAGLWHWKATHPDWAPENPADRGSQVSSYAIDDGDRRLILLDPLAVPREVEELLAERDASVVLTCPWHERDTRSLVDGYGARVFVPPPDEGSPDVAWLMTRRRKGHVFAAGDRLPVGVTALPGRDVNDVVLWVESRRVLVLGDTVIERHGELQVPEDWLSDGTSREDVVELLRPLLELPVELVLPTHGSPTDRAGLERALS
jgi:glyoxylase-like metal-dependent hydrolase (beta-lactamase superfamily II)